MRASVLVVGMWVHWEAAGGCCGGCCSSMILMLAAWDGYCGGCCSSMILMAEENTGPAPWRPVTTELMTAHAYLHLLA